MAVDFNASDELNLRGRLLLARHRPEEAEDFFRQSLAANPENGDSHYGLAQCLSHDRRRMHKALEEIEFAIASSPNWAPYHAYRALVLSDMHRHRDAREAIRTAQQLAPDEAYCWYCSGLVCRAVRDWPGVEAAARKALEFDPEDADHHNLLSVALHMQNKDGENTAVLERALEKDPENADTHANVGWSQLARDRDAAERHFMEALRLHAHHEIARKGLLKSFQNRNAVYRLFYRLQDRQRRFDSWQLFGICVGVAALVFVFCHLLDEWGVPNAQLAGFVMGLALMGVGFLALGIKALGHIVVLMDRRARLALNGEEKTAAWFVLGLVIFLVIRLLFVFLG